jgi:hypothetical protein
VERERRHRDAVREVYPPERLGDAGEVTFRQRLRGERLRDDPGQILHQLMDESPVPATAQSLRARVDRDDASGVEGFLPLLQLLGLRVGHLEPMAPVVVDDPPGEHEPPPLREELPQPDPVSPEPDTGDALPPAGEGDL